VYFLDYLFPLESELLLPLELLMQLLPLLLLQLQLLPFLPLAF